MDIRLREGLIQSSEQPLPHIYFKTTNDGGLNYVIFTLSTLNTRDCESTFYNTKKKI